MSAANEGQQQQQQHLPRQVEQEDDKEQVVSAPALDPAPTSGDEKGPAETESSQPPPPPPPPPSKYDVSRIRRLATPPNCRWDPAAPPAFTNALCFLYAFSATITVANLYYNQPILNRIAETFGVTYEQSSQAATLIQAGYAAGIVFLLPLGDMLERRSFIITIVFFTATIWIGLCATSSFTAFRALSFICGATTVTPQLMIPLAGDFAPVQRRGASISIIVSGLMGGMLVARLLSGVVANFTSWRNVYWIACGLQYLLALTLYFFMPDYPSTNAGRLGYLDALWSIPCILVKEPILVQACLLIFCTSCIFTCFWTTVTFLLASPPYNYDTLTIGLFALLTLPAIVCVPVYGRVIDRFVPHFSIAIGLIIVLTVVNIGTWTGYLTVAGPVIQGAGIDIGVQVLQVANRSAIFAIRPKARNRVNAAYMAAAFIGQLSGTALGNRLYAAGGWRASGSLSIGLAGFGICCLLVRGPRETGWVGWKGGWSIRKEVPIQPAPAQP